jgi:hypothetical protein
MPAGIVDGQEAADVAAFVASVSGADTGSATTGTGTTPAPPAPAPGGTATFTGDGATGIDVRLDEPAPAEWTVWLAGGAGPLEAGTIPAGGRRVRVASVDGEGLLGRFDSVLVGVDPAAPALSGELAPGRSEELQALLVSDPTRPGEASALDAARSQIDVLHDHVRFLAAARDEGNLANVRFHGEHMVNITQGRPLRDVDGNGDLSNPGDGLGLIDGRDAHLPRISSLAGPGVRGAVTAVSAPAAVIAAQGAIAGTSQSVDAARPAIAAIEAADARLDAAWARLRAEAGAAGVIVLEAP